MKPKSSSADPARQPGRTPPFFSDGYMLAIFGLSAGLLVILLGARFVWGSTSPVVELTWFNPLVFLFLAFVSICIAFLSLGRFQALGDPFSYWTGLGFAASSITNIFYFLAWPGLLPGGGSLIAHNPNTAGFISSVNAPLLVVFILAAVFARWPGPQHLSNSRWQVWGAGLTLFILGANLLVIAFESHLPAMVQPNGVYTPALHLLNGANMLLLSAGILLTIRRYLATRDSLAAHIAILLISVLFATLVILVGSRRYDLWWYLGRLMMTSSFLAVFFTLLAGYANLFRREREGESRYRQLAESLPQLVWTALPGGLCDYLSPQWVSYTGIPASQQLGRAWLSQIHPADRARVEQAWQAAVSQGTHFDIEYRLRRHDGQYRWFKTLGLPLHSLGGQVERWFGSSTDIDEQKQYAARLEQMNRDLRSFTLAASHDLHEPLRKIEVLGDAVLEALPSANGDGHLAERLQRMRRSARRMRGMVDSLHTLTHLAQRPLSIEDVDLNEVARQVLDTLHEKIETSGAYLDLRQLPTLQADRDEMRTLLTNLLDNALQFQAPGSPPHIRVHAVQPAPGEVQISVQDNGLGFDEAFQEHIFEPFTRVAPQHRPENTGAGMGLVICRWIVERHHGKITARSRPGQGARLVVTLPKIQPHA